MVVTVSRKVGKQREYGLGREAGRRSMRTGDGAESVKVHAIIIKNALSIKQLQIRARKMLNS